VYPVWLGSWRYMGQSSEADPGSETKATVEKVAIDKSTQIIASGANIFFFISMHQIFFMLLFPCSIFGCFLGKSVFIKVS
jgi:hypothetical protein